MNENEILLQKFLLDAHDKHFPDLIRVANIDSIVLVQLRCKQ